ncbi:MAG: hypothetical protein AAF108_08495 [Planctomycetota bacterium]
MPKQNNASNHGRRGNDIVSEDIEAVGNDAPAELNTESESDDWQLGVFDPSLPDLPFEEQGPTGSDPWRADQGEQMSEPLSADFKQLNRGRGPGRRLSDFVKSAEEGEMTREQFLFLRAIEAFKTANRKTYPNWTEVLEVVRLLGYRKTLSSELNLSGVEDWQEKPNAASNVRTREGVRHSRRKKAA